MPLTKDSQTTDLALSPNGEYVAAAGPTGVQLFVMHGANPITPLPGAFLHLANAVIFWDKHLHLYALAPGSGKLYVFNVTGSGAAPAQGSPYTIASASSMIVLPN